MNNIYDVILNFNKFYYEVYEWKNDDDIENIRKIPFFKVCDKTYLILKNYDVVINKNTLELLKKNCCYFDESSDNFRFLVTNGTCSMGIIINNKGYIIGRSSMIYEEEEEVVMESRNIEETKFIFDKVIEINNYSSRLEYEKKEVLFDFVNNTSDKMVLKYIYYDYYLVECDDLNKIKNDLIDEIKTCDNYKLLKLYDTIKLLLNTT